MNIIIGIGLIGWALMVWKANRESNHPSELMAFGGLALLVVGGLAVLGETGPLNMLLGFWSGYRGD